MTIFKVFVFFRSHFYFSSAINILSWIFRNLALFYCLLSHKHCVLCLARIFLTKLWFCCVVSDIFYFTQIRKLRHRLHNLSKFPPTKCEDWDMDPGGLILELRLSRAAQILPHFLRDALSKAASVFFLSFILYIFYSPTHFFNEYPPSLQNVDQHFRM